ncbi:MAG TPA: hypothetical protein VGL22_08505 [Terracidiphilus sp.]
MAQRSAPGPDCVAESPIFQPYTAEFRFTDTSMLADGKTAYPFVHSGVEAADSRGRTIVADSYVAKTGKHPDLGGSRIFDPVAGTEILWSARENMVMVWKMPDSANRHGCWQVDSDRFKFSFNFDAPAFGGCASRQASFQRAQDQRDAPSEKEAPQAGEAASADAVAAMGRNAEPQTRKPTPIYEELGTAMIAGVEARGYRWTYPPGNGVQSEEHWVATDPALGGLWVRQAVQFFDNPGRTKSWMKELVNLRLGEPDVAGFEPPADIPVTRKEMRPISCAPLHADPR